jgi:hypothetical protein
MFTLAPFFKPGATGLPEMTDTVAGRVHEPTRCAPGGRGRAGLVRLAPPVGSQVAQQGLDLGQPWALSQRTTG